MKIVVINATEKKGVTFRLKKAFLSRFKNKDVIVEFYLPRGCPSLCAGCTTCFLKDQNLCKDAAFVQKIEKEMLGGFSFALGGRRNLDNREQLGLDNHISCRSPKSLIQFWTNGGIQIDRSLWPPFYSREYFLRQRL